MKRFIQVSVVLLVLLLAGTSMVFASKMSQETDDVVIGGQLYDRWYAVLNVEPPAGDMPIWARQTTNTRSGEDTWRCSECHGWDYKGHEGAYSSGSHYTGFPNVMRAADGLTTDEIVGHLQGQKDPAHDFSEYMDATSMRQLAVFLKEGLIDDAQYIDSASLRVIGGNLDHGKALFEQRCTECHGEDGKKIIFRSEGVDEYLGSVANRDPWRFLHRTRFGVAGTEMPVGYTFGWTPSDGRDVLKYAQTLPVGVEAQPSGSGSSETGPGTIFGGPATNIWTGILTGLGAFLGIFSSSLVFISVLVGIVALVVWALRRRR
ncbi:MAG: hypothetical protein GXP40_13325 [Chloroflexi bacterium]|nr:hypothetical protein [Chloroflexota bacterium]